MSIDITKFIKLALLLSFVFLAPFAVLSQSKDDNPLKVSNPPSPANSVQNPNGTITWLYHVQNRHPKELEPLLREYLVNRLKPSRYVIYAENNSILFTIKKEYFPLLEKLLAKLDVARPRVLIEVKIFSLSYNKQQQSGFEAKHDISQKASNANVFYRGFEMTYHPEDFIKALTANPSSQQAAQNDFLGATMFFSAQGSTLARLGGLDVAIRLLAKSEKITLVARPVVIVEAGYRAKIETGEEYPVSYVRISGNNTIVDTNFKSVGIKLEMLPLNIGTEYVHLFVKPEISAISSYFNPGGLGVSNPIIIRRNAQTKVTLKSNQTLEIGGLKSDRTLINSTGIPLLSDIPLLGYLFRSNSVEVRRQEIIFFITPRIIKPNELITPEQFKSEKKYTSSNKFAGK